MNENKLVMVSTLKESERIYSYLIRKGFEEYFNRFFFRKEANKVDLLGHGNIAYELVAGYLIAIRSLRNPGKIIHKVEPPEIDFIETEPGLARNQVYYFNGRVDPSRGEDFHKYTSHFVFREESMLEDLENLIRELGPFVGGEREIPGHFRDILNEIEACNV